MSDPEAESDEVVEQPPPPETFAGAPVSRSRGQRVLHPSRDGYLGCIAALKADGYLMCIDVTAVDYLTARATRALPEGIAAERFEVVTNLLRHRPLDRLHVRVQVPGDDPRIASLFDLYPGSEAMEREAYDMFGISFEGHPDMTRILLPEDWYGHPLRKDYAVGKIPVQFKGTASGQ